MKIKSDTGYKRFHTSTRTFHEDMRQLYIEPTTEEDVRAYFKEEREKWIGQMFQIVYVPTYPTVVTIYRSIDSGD